jgi:hypothetical protein
LRELAAAVMARDCVNGAIAEAAGRGVGWLASLSADLILDND